MSIPTDRNLPKEVWPTTNTSAALMLIHASDYLDQDRTCYIPNHPVIARDYNDHKASQLLNATADLILAKARISSWSVDLGFNGCQAAEGDCEEG